MKYLFIFLLLSGYRKFELYNNKNMMNKMAFISPEKKNDSYVYSGAKKKRFKIR